MTTFKDIKVTRAFEITFLSSTLNLGARVKIKDQLYNETVIIDFNYTKNNITEMALDYLNSKNIECIAVADFNAGTVLITKNMTTRLKGA